ncbi:MAG: histidine kinase [Hyphomicrobiales bacterium]|nr:MAG: histidine kinase [Hyphomicrobiales bacterium]
MATDIEPTSGDDLRGRPRRRRFGLSSKLLVLTILFVMLSEVLIYLPSIANFRETWLRDQVHIASVAAAVHPGTTPIDPMSQKHLMEISDALAIAASDGERRRLIALSSMPVAVDRVIDIREQSIVGALLATFDTLLNGGDRIIRVIGPPAMGDGFVEILLPDARLRAAMLEFSQNIMALSLIISIITATLVYFSLRWLFVRPLQRLTTAMEGFAEDPEDPERKIAPSGRSDEIGDTERGLAAMQDELARTLQQQRHLADLGLAVSKINHDLRNILASAQLFSDHLESVPDPVVQKVTPKLVASLDRALVYTRSVLAYGRAEEAAPQRRVVVLKHLVDDVGELLGIGTYRSIEWVNQVSSDLEVNADPDQLIRVLMNLCRNSVQALEASDDPALVRRIEVSASRPDGKTVIRVRDTGPGVPARAREKLFQAFRGSARAGGTGLGLAIAAELTRAHGGTIALIDNGPGALFEITLPDRAENGPAANGNGKRNGLRKDGRPDTLPSRPPVID